LTPTTTPSNATSGMMYFDQNSGVFKCFQKNQESNFVWMDCGGVGRPERVANLTIPVQIYDSSGIRLVLEITEE